MATGLGFDRKLAAFTSKGQTIARDKVRSLANTHAMEVSTKLKQLTHEALTVGMDATEYQSKFAGILKTGYIQSGLLGRGGKSATTQSDYGKLGSLLKKQYAKLGEFTQQLADGELTLKQAVARAGQYGTSTLQAYGHMEQAAIGDSRINWARRKLTSGVKHCPECVDLATYPKYLPVGNLTPIGVDCRCHGNCQCAIEYAVNPPMQLRSSGRAIDPLH